MFIFCLFVFVCFLLLFLTSDCNVFIIRMKDVLTEVVSKEAQVRRVSQEREEIKVQYIEDSMAVYLKLPSILGTTTEVGQFSELQFSI